VSRITPQEVREIAALARIAFDDQEIARLTGELDAVLAYVATLREIDTTGVEPMTHAVPFDCPLRPDVPEAPLPAEDVLRNAPRRAAHFFEVPRMMSAPDDGGGSPGTS